MPVRWKWDGKTVELSNTEPATYVEQQAAELPVPPTEGGPPVRRPRRDEIEKLARKENRELERMWRKQVDMYYKGMRDVQRGKTESFDAAAGMQELLDTGAVWEEEDGGLGSYFKGRGGQVKNDAMVRAHDAYVDFMKNHGNTAYDPDLGWYNPDLGAPMVPDSGGRLIVRRPDGSWAPAFGEGVINGD